VVIRGTNVTGIAMFGTASTSTVSSTSTSAVTTVTSGAAATLGTTSNDGRFAIFSAVGVATGATGGIIVGQVTAVIDDPGNSITGILQGSTNKGTVTLKETLYSRATLGTATGTTQQGAAAGAGGAGGTVNVSGSGTVTGSGAIVNPGGSGGNAGANTPGYVAVPVDSEGAVVASTIVGSGTFNVALHTIDKVQTLTMTDVLTVSGYFNASLTGYATRRLNGPGTLVFSEPVITPPTISTSGSIGAIPGSIDIDSKTVDVNVNGVRTSYTAPVFSGTVTVEAPSYTDTIEDVQIN
jgi:hypothetical protein